MVHRVDAAGKRIVANDPPSGTVPPGAGPRHLSFHPSGRFVYVINEIASSLSVFAYDGASGALDLRQTISTLPEGFTGTSHTAQVVVHPSGRFVYGSNRGDDSIAMFRIDQDSGLVTLIGHESTQGETPRNFNIDPSGTLLLAGNQASDTVVPFRIDQETGRLTATDHVSAVPSPVCIIFRPV